MTQQLQGTLNAKGTLGGSLSEKGQLGGSVAPQIIETYAGPYVITPKAEEEQTLPTKSKKMASDVLVKEIPYYETSNVAGTTVYIGG